MNDCSNANIARNKLGRSCTLSDDSEVEGELNLLYLRPNRQGTRRRRVEKKCLPERKFTALLEDILLT